MHFFDESFWIAVSFLIFLYFAYKPIKKAIINSLDAKIDEIKKQLEETEKLKQEAKELLAEVKEQITNFESRKAQIIDSAEESTSKFIELRAKEIDLSLARIKDSAIKTIENKQSKASAELRNKFIDSVMTTVRDYLTLTKDDSDLDKEIIEKLTKTIKLD